jgi:sigma-B regulation protein RsbU (phosphoserine phosphatase)
MAASEWDHAEQEIRNRQELDLLDRRRRLQLASPVGPRSEIERLIGEIDSALARIEAGTYGRCEFCHDPIEAESLAADPLVRYCVDHLSERQRQALQRDLDLAMNIQTALLPTRELRTPQWEACYHYQPAGPVSGDYCDLMALDGNGDLFFVVGDISGKGIAASLLMSHLHAIFRSLLSTKPTVANLVSSANRLFCDSTQGAHYATVTCGFARASGEVEICNAGHCPPIVQRDGRTETVPSTGIPLGLFASAQYATYALRMDAADLLLIYTDGITEARSATDEEYGPQRLQSALGRARQFALRAVADECLGDLRKFLSGASTTDDQTLMAIRRTA